MEKKKQPSNLEETFRNLPMCFVVLLFTAGLSYYEYVTVTNSKNSFSDSLLLFQKFQSEQMSIDKEYLNVFQPQFYLDANGLVYNQILAPIITKTDFVTKTLPATFSKYFHTN